MSEKFIRFRELQNKIGISRTTVWRLERAGDFPKRVKISKQIIGWRDAEIAEWMQSRGFMDVQTCLFPKERIRK